MSNVLQYILLAVFVLVAITTLLGIIQIKPFHRIQPRYLAAMFFALVTPLIALVISAGEDVFLPSKVEHYRWEISYPLNLEKRFADNFLQDKDFARFYVEHRFKKLGEIKNDGLPRSVFERYVDTLFILKKSSEFANQNAKGELFIIRDDDEGPSYGKAVLTFPYERQPIAFDVKTSFKADGPWKLEFYQPPRWVKYDGRVNEWKGGRLEVDFSEHGGVWIGELLYSEVSVGKFTLDPS